MTRSGTLREALLQVALQPRRLANLLGRGMKGAGAQDVMVVAVDHHRLKLLECHGSGAAMMVTHAASAPVSGASGESLRRALAQARLVQGASGRALLLAVPTHLCTIRLFSLPSTDPNEIRDIVELQAEKHTPYAKDEILTDFAILDRDRPGYSRVLLVIAHQDIVRRSLQLLEPAEAALERVGCELEGLVRWGQEVRNRIKGARPPGETLLILDVDAEATTLLVLQRGQPVFHRSLALGAEPLAADPEATIAKFVAELHRSREAIDADAGAAKFSHIVLTGCAGRLGGLKEAVERELSLPVTLTDPFEGCGLTGPAREAAAQIADVSFAGLAGLVCGASHGAIDLTPQATKLQQAFEARAKTLVVLGCQAVAVFILMTLLVVGRAHREQRHYDTLRARYARDAEDTRHLEAALRGIEFIKERLRHRGELLGAAEALATLSPQEIRWESLTYAQGESIILKGVSEALPKVYEFVAALDASPTCRDVEAKRVLKGAGEQGEEVTSFEVNCAFTGVAAP